MSRPPGSCAVQPKTTDSEHGPSIRRWFVPVRAERDGARFTDATQHGSGEDTDGADVEIVGTIYAIAVDETAPAALADHMTARFGDHGFEVVVARIEGSGGAGDERSCRRTLARIAAGGLSLAVSARSDIPDFCAAAVVAQIERLEAHLGIAASLWRRRRLAERQRLTRVVEALPFPAAVLSADGSVMAMNPEAIPLIDLLVSTVAAHTGGQCASVPGACDTPARPSLSGLLAGPDGRVGSERFVVLPVENGGFALAQVVPCGAFVTVEACSDAPLNTIGEDPSAMVIFRRPPSAPPSLPEPVAAAFGLTRAEARLIEAMIAGVSTREFATAAGVSHNTVRTHLARIMVKTGRRRQAELVGFFAAFATAGEAG